MKREIMYEDSAPNVVSRPPTKCKSDGKAQVVSLLNGKTSCLVDPTMVVSQSSHAKDYQMGGMNVDILDAQPKPQHTSRKLPVISRKARSGLADEQVSFIIVTRDNVKPDPYGQQSSTYGPLPWPAVADAYNQKFRVGQKAVGSAAMEKRARQHREEWMLAWPGYPQNVVYAKKLAIAKAERKREFQSERTTHVTKPIRKDQRTAHVERSKGSDPNSEQDIYVSTKSNISASGPDHDEHTTIEVCDVYETVVGVLQVRTQDIIKTSALVAEERKVATSLCITLQAPSVKAVERYINCISPEQSIALPEFDGKQGRQRHARIASRIEWDFTALVDLYNVATAMKDFHVRNLVIHRWTAMLDWDIELEIDVQAINSLFDSTQPGDHARAFWTTALYSSGAAQKVLEKKEYHSSLVGMLEELLAH